MEKWLDVPNYEGLYQVSDLGRIKSLGRVLKYFRCDRSEIQIIRKKEQILKPTLNNKGYYCVTLYKEGKSTYFEVHRVVASAFLGYIPKPYALNCDHKDNDKLNNKVDNLQIVTVRKNSSKDQKNRSSKFVGVSYIKPNKKWKASIRFKGKDCYLGSFDSEIAASEAYQTALKEIQDTNKVTTKTKKYEY